MSDIENAVNIPLLRKAVEWAEVEAAKSPDLCEWEQSGYYFPKDIVQGLGRAPECGACFCIAGYVADQMGTELVNGGIDAPEIAQRELGLTGAQSSRLFHVGNTIADVRRIAEDIAGERL